MFKIIAWPFGKLMWLCWLVLKNYGVALFVFTLIIKLILLPSSVKQQKSMVRMAKINPKLEQLKKKYANNQEKLNEATMELYNQENINPMGSCLPMILTFVILFAIVEVVYAPLTYISGIDSDKIDAASTTLTDIYSVSSVLKENGKTVSGILSEETDLYDALMSYETIASKDEETVKSVAEALQANPGLDEYITDTQKVSSKLVQNTGRTELLVLSVAKDYPALFDAEIAEFCEGFDYTFLGVYLGAYPSWNSWLLLIPILSFLSQLAVTIVSQYYSKKQNGAAASANKSMTAMLYIMPLFSFWLAFSYPAGLGIYWIFSAVLSLLQTVFLHVYLTPERVDKMIEKENKKKRKPSIYQMALEQQKAQLAAANGGTLPEKNALDEFDEDVKLSKSERKEVERQRLNDAREAFEKKYGVAPADEELPTVEEENEILAAARKRMAEKYGD